MAQNQGRPEPKRPHRVIAERVRELRKRRGMTAARLAEEMTQAGVKWDRTIVTNLENGRRSAVSVEEALTLAYVLDVAPVHLIVPLSPDGWYAVTPDEYRTRNDRVRAWIRGAYALEGHTDQRAYFSEVPEDEWVPPRQLSSEEQEEVEHRLAAAGLVSRVRVDRETGEAQTYDAASRTWVKLPPVVTAIVTSDLGVLVGRRYDDKPPWTFIAGEQEPGERPEDTVIREVKEEASLRIEVGEQIGQRVHPKTGRTLIYMAAWPTHGTDIFVGDDEELAEVRWVSLAEAEQLMKTYGMFEPVHEYLSRELGRKA